MKHSIQVKINAGKCRACGKAPAFAGRQCFALSKLVVNHSVFRKVLPGQFD